MVCSSPWSTAFAGSIWWLAMQWGHHTQIVRLIFRILTSVSLLVSITSGDVLARSRAPITHDSHNVSPHARFHRQDAGGQNSGQGELMLPGFSGRARLFGNALAARAF